MRQSQVKRRKAESPIEYSRAVDVLVKNLEVEAHTVSERLRFNTGHRDENAHKRAYRDLFNSVRSFLTKVPEPADGVVVEPPKPLEATDGGKPEIPFVVKDDHVFMACPKPQCYNWIDVSNIFSKHLFDGVYECQKGHRIIFGSVSAEPSKEMNVLPQIKEGGE